MPLSVVAKKALADSARINAEKRRVRRQQQKADEQERQRLESEYNDYVLQEAEIKKQLELLEAQEREEIEKASKTESERLALREKYDSQISMLIEERDMAIANIPKTKSVKVITGSGGGFPQGDETDIIEWVKKPKDNAEIEQEQNEIFSTYQSQIEKAQRDHNIASNYFEFNVKYPGVPVQGSLRKAFKNSQGQLSLVNLYEAQQRSREAVAERRRQSSIKNAQSNAIKEREKLEFTVREFEEKKNSSPNTTRKEALQYDLQTATKKKPQIYDSSFFRDHESSVIPKSIIGTSKETSAKAKFTLKEIETQQKELERNVRNAKNTQEALAIRQKAREENPYVGTANVYLRKGEVKEQYGVLVDLKLDKKFDESAIDSRRANPEIQVYEATKDTDNLISIPDVKPESKTTKEIPYYEFVDESGNKKQVSQKDIFLYASSLIEKKAQLPSETDKKINQYLQENPQNISFAENKSQSGEVIDPLNDQPLLKGFLDTGTELKESIANVFRPEDQQVKFDETLEGALVADLIGQGSRILGKEYNEARLSDYIKEKVKTPEGQQELAGSAFGAVVLNYGLSMVPGLLHAKVTGKLIQKAETKKITKIADDVVSKLEKTPESVALRKKLDTFPEMPEQMKRELLKKSNLQKVVGYELLDSKTALIKRGTESGEELSPYIVVRLGKNPRSTVYQTYTEENPGAFREIIVSGKQNKELAKGVKMAGGAVAYPATRDNVLIASETNKLAKVGIKEDVGQAGLIDNPNALIEKIEAQKVKTGSVIAETERLNPIKSMNQQVKGLKPDDVSYKVGKGDRPKSKTSLNDVFASPVKKSDVIDIPSAKSTGQTLKESSKPVSAQTKKLEKFIRLEQKGIEIIEGRSTKLRTYSASAGLIASRQNARDAIKIDTDAKQLQRQSLQTQQEIKTDVITRQSVIDTQRTKLRSDLIELEKQKPVIDPRYSLIVSGGYKTGTKQTPLYKLEQKTKIGTPPPKPPQKTKTTQPKPPGLNISLDLEDKKEIVSKKPKGKLRIGYYRWNVNTDSVGQYLPTRDLSTGRTRKVIEKIDRLESKVNKTGYWKKVRQKEEKYFKTGLQERKESLIKKARVTQISKPRVSKKQKKRFPFNLNLGL